jgi:MinD superfamily P-loop ATPase
MKELVIISGKGGTGKTSITAALASLAHDFVLADCDVDAADLHLLLRPKIKTTNEFIGGKIAQIDLEICTACGKCRELCRFQAIGRDFIVDFSCEGCGVCVWNCPENAIAFNPRKSGEWYISDTRYAPMVHARLGIAEENSGKLVTLVRQKARELGNDTNAKLMLVDGPPGTGCPVISAIGGADHLLIVTEPSKSAMHDMEKVIQVAMHFKVPFSVCINKYDLNNSLSELIEKHCRENGIFLAGKLSFDPIFTQAQIQGKSILEVNHQQVTFEIKQLWTKMRSRL